MTGGLTPDEDLVRRLPLPLAQLYRRAHNAKTPLDRHNAAYCLWEAALKLLGSVAIVAYAERGAIDAGAGRAAEEPRPALAGTLVGVRPAARAACWPRPATTGFRQVRDLVLGRQRDDLPRAAGLDAALLEVLDGTAGGRVTVRLSELFERLVRYRNQEIGHGAAGPAARPRSTTGWVGPSCSGWSRSSRRLDVLAGRRLVYVADVRRQASGNWLVERYELVGEASARLESLERPEAEASLLPRPGRVYLDVPCDPRAGSRAGRLHPLVLCDFEPAEVFFLNSRRGKRRTEYLCYHPGRVVERTDLGDEQRAAAGARPGHGGGPGAGRAWAASSQAEEPPLPRRPRRNRRAARSANSSS